MSGPTLGVEVTIDPQVVWAVVAVAAALGGLAGAVWAQRRAHLIAGIPTSRVRGVFAGLNEVKGTARCAAPLRATLSGQPCVWFSFTVEEHWRRTRTVTDSKGNRRTTTTTGWDTVDSGEGRCPFELVDDTGAIAVLPDGADIDGVVVFDREARRGGALYSSRAAGRSVAGSTGRRRFVEHAVPVDARLYVLGPAVLRPDASAPVITEDDDAGPFLISTRDEARILRTTRWWAAGWTLLALVGAGGIGTVLTWDPVTGRPALPFVGLALAFGLAVLLGAWTVLTYNTLVQLREREARAWSLVEVQLARRADLLGALAEVVRAAAAHEHGVQASLAALRATAEPTPPTERAPSPARVATGTRTAEQQAATGHRLVALAESSPTLRADASFDHLQAQLVDCEDRLALAREFFNESVTVLRTTSQRFPSSVVARLGRFTGVELFAADGIERTVPVVPPAGPR